MIFRDLKADEIECRIQQVNKKKQAVVLLLYKDARCDMNILDETVGPMNWKREHTRENANCIVSLWDSEKKQWVSKEDTGKESFTEAEKGLASDSFKRACFNWGVGRELYTAPFIWITSDKCDITQDGKCYDKFDVESITIENKQITDLKIYNTSKKCVAFDWSKKKGNQAPKSAPKQDMPPAPQSPKPTGYYCEKCGKPFEDVMQGGQIFTAEYQYNNALQKRGGAYCKSCYEAMKAGH